MSPLPMLAPDAAMVLGIASTAMPFARDPEAEVERWLRILRLHGEAGAALQGVGVGEGVLPSRKRAEPDEVVAVQNEDCDPVAQVAEQACRIAALRGAAGITTIDLLLAVMHVYGTHFDRQLEAHGTDRAELTERLGATAPVDDACPIS